MDTEQQVYPVTKMETRIPGFDAIAAGGVPRGRTCLVSGTSGSAKTIFAVQFLAEGARAGEPGVFVTFEETPHDLRRNMLNFGWDVAAWERQNLWAFVDASPHLSGETMVVGDYDLEALIQRVDHAINKVGARRLSMDSIGAVFGQFADAQRVRQELLRLVATLKAREVTALITAERIDEYGPVARHGVEEFVNDNVIILRNVLYETRRRRTVEILKFRGATHAKGEYPFSVRSGEGVVVIPLPALSLPQRASRARVSSGNAELDAMCGGGLFRDATVLVSGATGTGKTLLATHFLSAVEAGERALLFAFEEGYDQLVRNAAGWGIDLEKMAAEGRLRVACTYPEVTDLDDHLIDIRRQIDAYRPQRVVVDSLSALERMATVRAFREFVIALIADLKQRGIMALFTTTTPTFAGETPILGAHISTVADVIVLLRHVEFYGEVQRGIAVLKVRGSGHDQRIREVQVDAGGLHIGKPIRNVAGVLSGDLSYIMDGGVGFTAGAVPKREERVL